MKDCKRNQIPQKKQVEAAAVDDFQFRFICSSSLPSRFPPTFRLANHLNFMWMQCEQEHTSALTPSPCLQSRLQTSISCFVLSWENCPVKDHVFNNFKSIHKNPTICIKSFCCVVSPGQVIAALVRPLRGKKREKT